MKRAISPKPLGAGQLKPEMKRGGPGRGQGRKPVAEGEQTVTVSLRMTVAQRDKLATLGGAGWVRQRIDKAKTPNASLEGRGAGLPAERPSRSDCSTASGD